MVGCMVPRRAWRRLLLPASCFFLLFLSRRTRVEEGTTGVAGGPAVAPEVDAKNPHTPAMEALFLELQKFDPYAHVPGRGVSPSPALFLRLRGRVFEL
jgi:hypothetical protein